MLVVFFLYSQTLLKLYFVNMDILSYSPECCLKGVEVLETQDVLSSG